MVRIFPLKSFLEKLLVTISWVIRIYIVLVKICEKAHSKSSGREFRGSLATWLESWMTCKIQSGKDFKFRHVLLMWPFRVLALVSQSWASHEFFILTKSSLISYTTLTLSVCLVWLILSTYFTIQFIFVNYLWVLLHFLALFMGLIILF